MTLVRQEGATIDRTPALGEDAAMAGATTAGATPKGQNEKLVIAASSLGTVIE